MKMENNWLNKDNIIHKVIFFMCPALFILDVSVLKISSSLFFYEATLSFGQFLLRGIFQRKKGVNMVEEGKLPVTRNHSIRGVGNG